LNLAARRKIVVGEEITIDYGTFYNENMEDFACSCNAAECRKMIRGTDYKEPFIERYRGHVSDYVKTRRSHLAKINATASNCDELVQV
jgi:hypothetical protein